jgi:hypothetical protein
VLPSTTGLSTGAALTKSPIKVTIKANKTDKNSTVFCFFILTENEKKEVLKKKALRSKNIIFFLNHFYPLPLFIFDPLLPKIVST